jgi:hypothetical protein
VQGGRRSTLSVPQSLTTSWSDSAPGRADSSSCLAHYRQFPIALAMDATVGPC